MRSSLAQNNIFIPMAYKMSNSRVIRALAKKAPLRFTGGGGGSRLNFG